jgi:hypothetical protein
MNDRRLRILNRLAENSEESMDQLCGACMDVTELSGAGIMLMFADEPLGSVGMTNAVSSLIEELQFTLGEGPCIDAYNLAQPIAEPDLAKPTRKWFGFTPPALDAGVRAIFSFPLQVGTTSWGALDLYRDHPGTLTADQHADALVLARIVTDVVINIQTNAAPGTLAAELTRVTEHRVVVHQAVGMVSVQLGVSVSEALIRMRAHAFGSNRQLAEIADDVVARRLRFE